VSIQRVPSVPFAQIANEALRDKRLSFKARGILALVLSHSGEWTAPMRWLESQSEHDGRAAIQAGLNELTDLGYRVVTKERQGTEIRTIVVWQHASNMSKIRPSEDVIVRESDDQQSCVSIEHHSSEHHSLEHHEESSSWLFDRNVVSSIRTAISDDLNDSDASDASVDSSRRKNVGTVASVRQIDAFDVFWDVYPRRVAKKAAQRAWATACKNTPPENIIEGAKRYRDDPHRDAQYTAHPATWLNNERWFDDPMPIRRVATGGDRRMQQYEHLMNQFSNGREIGQ
jgi:hypothetical protein